MVNDGQVKATKSPFAMRQNEVKVFDGKEGYASVNQAVFMIDMGYINELHFQMLEIINEFEFITSRQLYQVMQIRGIEIKDQNKVNDRLENLIKSKVITRYFFQSDEGKGIYRIYCLDKIGKYLLNSRSIQCEWVPTDNTKPVFMLKRRLAGNQVLLAYQTKAKYFRNYVIDPVLTAKRQNIRFKVSGGVVTMEKDERVYDFVFEVVRRNPGWTEKFIEKMRLYAEFYEYFNTKDAGFDVPPQMVIVGEDDTHLVEIFKEIVKNRIVLKDSSVIYTTDLRQLDDTLENSIITFNYDEAKGKYVMDVYSSELLAPKLDGDDFGDIEIDTNAIIE